MSDYDKDKNDTLQKLANTINFAINDDDGSVLKYGFSLVVLEIECEECSIARISNVAKEDLITLYRKEADYLESSLSETRKH